MGNKRKTWLSLVLISLLKGSVVGNFGFTENYAKLSYRHFYRSFSWIKTRYWNIYFSCSHVLRCISGVTHRIKLRKEKKITKQHRINIFLGHLNTCSNAIMICGPLEYCCPDVPPSESRDEWEGDPVISIDRTGACPNPDLHLLSCRPTAICRVTGEQPDREKPRFDLFYYNLLIVYYRELRLDVYKEEWLRLAEVDVIKISGSHTRRNIHCSMYWNVNKKVTDECRKTWEFTISSDRKNRVSCSFTTVMKCI